MYEIKSDIGRFTFSENSPNRTSTQNGGHQIAMRFLIEISENGFTKLQPVPARMGMPEASGLLGISKTDLAYLTSQGELEIIGNPERNQEKFLCAEDVLTKSRDKRWLSKKCLNMIITIERRGDCQGIDFAPSSFQII